MGLRKYLKYWRKLALYVSVKQMESSVRCGLFLCAVSGTVFFCAAGI